MNYFYTEIEGKEFSHRILWNCCMFQKRRKYRFNKGQFYIDVSVLLLAYFALEAYINYVCKIVDPQKWKNEKDEFSKGKFRGTEGKYDYIVEKCGLPKLKKGERPYQSIKKVKKIRDYFTHGKLIDFKYKKIHKDGREPDIFHRPLDDLITSEKADMYFNDIQKFIIEFHENLKKSKFGDKLSSHPFKGPTSISSNSTKIKT